MEHNGEQPVRTIDDMALGIKLINTGQWIQAREERAVREFTRKYTVSVATSFSFQAHVPEN